MRKAASSDLLFVSKSPKDKLGSLEAGASLVQRTGYQIKELRSKAADDRLALARALLRDASAAMLTSPALYRTAVSRSYYSMYHALRAAAYLYHGGDDHEQHTVLPSKIPDDFPDKKNWENTLKNARLERNRADYDPYPRSDRDFAAIAQSLLQSATDLIPIARTYLRSKP